MRPRTGTAILLLAILTLGGTNSADVGTATQVNELGQALLPKRETRATEFLEQFPEFDGRGVTVAIFDTGVDPGAPWLTTTPQGENKFVDLIDATGDGDVSTKEIQKSVDGRLNGLTNRILTIDTNWTNPTGDFRLGIKSAWELFPPELVTRMQAERKRNWDEAQRLRLHELQAELEAEGADLPAKKERQARIDVLKSAISKYQDPGPLYDCVVFHDGDVWRAVVDTDEDGDLAEEALLTDYDKEPRFATFGGNSSLNFTVHIYDGGETLSLVTVSGEHGTHVAGIVAAYDPENSHRNGLAPGARIVSVKIGDNRLDGMETGTALVRAVPAVIKHQCDLINMSYGEPGTPANSGRVVEYFSKLVREHGIIFVASAGNAGPALSTVGAPGGTSTPLIGVGAYISPAMMQAEYTLRDEVPGVAYTWTSRGPTTDGDSGVDIFAPGGAIASVPNYSLQPARQMNGTSMASPNACGNIALLLSGMKSRELPYNHVSVLGALQHTAVKIDGTDSFAQGAGLIQIDRAFEYLTAERVSAAELVEIDVDIQGARGIYLREQFETNQVADRTITLKPRFTQATTNEQKLAYEVPLRLESTVDWVDVGPLMLLPHDGRPMTVQVDPTQLELGAHAAEILGYDDRFPERGPLVRIPVTVVRSEQSDAGKFAWTAATEPGNIVRQFVAVPENSSAATLSIRRLGGDNVRMGFVHLVQLVPGQTFEQNEHQWVVRLDGNEHVEHDFAVVPGRTLELCWGHYWSSLGAGEFEFELTFHGITTSQSRVALSPGLPAKRLDVALSMQPGQVEVTGELTTLRRLFAPAKSDIKGLTGERDQLPNAERTHVLQLNYEVEMAEANDVTLRIPQLQGLLYESPLDGLLMSIVDEQGRKVATQDLFADETTALPAGSVTVQLELKHSDESVLQRWKQLLLAVDQPLSNEIAVPIAQSPSLLAAGKKTVPAVELQPGERITVWVGCPSLSGVTAQPGDLLLGELTVAPDIAGLILPIEVTVPPTTAEAAEAAQPAKSLDRKLTAAEALDEFRYERLAALEYPADKEQIELLASELRERHPEDCRLDVTLLHLLDTAAHREEQLGEVVAAADRVLKLIPRAKVQAYFGLRQNPESSAEKQLHETRSAQKRDLIDALFRKCRALAYMELPEVVAQHPIEDQAQLDADFKATFNQLSRWTDTQQPEYVLLHVRKLRRAGELGLAIQMLQKDLQRPGRDDRQHHEKLRDMYESLGWSDWQDYEQRLMLEAK